MLFFPSSFIHYPSLQTHTPFCPIRLKTCGKLHPDIDMGCSWELWRVCILDNWHRMPLWMITSKHNNEQSFLRDTTRIWRKVLTFFVRSFFFQDWGLLLLTSVTFFPPFLSIFSLRSCCDVSPLSHHSASTKANSVKLCCRHQVIGSPL